jgi:protein-S-isoprenylcysteine O-methyltransferase Ste14
MLIVAVVLIAIFLIQIPMMVARNRNIDGGKYTSIAVLSWFGIICGITWLVALILSLVWAPGADLYANQTDIEKLEKLHKLYKSGAINKQEFDAEKKKILG